MRAVNNEAKMPSVSADGEAFHRAARLPKQNRRRDKRRHVGVEDGAKSFLIGCFDRDLERFSESHFFAQSFVNEHVRVHRQANRQNDASDSR